MQDYTGIWQIGDIRVTRVLEGESLGPLVMLPEATPEEILKMPWLQPHFADEEGQARISIHALVIEAGGKVIVVDTCLGNDKTRIFPHWNQLQTDFMDKMRAAGYPPEAVDYVLCTHMHTDPVGWNTMLVDGEWVPTFPKARYLFGREEWDYTKEQIDNPMMAEFIVDSLQPIVDADLADFVEMDADICDGVRLIPTPGHTPGHVSVVLESGGEKAVITGDIMHHPCQVTQPRWKCEFDWQREPAEETRETMLKQFAEEGTLVFGTHFATPSAGRVIDKGDHYRFEV
jgi:glyoxylase-like metal-dependent hydrolase (beta-lactamase superfamily II)